MLENELASFWSDKMSRLFTGTPEKTTTRVPARMTPSEKAQRAKRVAAKGYSYSQIASELGVTKGTVINYLKGYPYKKG